MVSSSNNTLIQNTIVGDNLSKRATQIADEIRTLEREFRQEIQRIRIDSFEIREKAIHFKYEVVTRHRTQALGLPIARLHHGQCCQPLSDAVFSIVWYSQ
jgi:hypothetical protein